ncbi:hypothetical protein EG340_07010 [Chryseobacterium indoltheticum]|uniref:Uncharacterized protein n=1 Tax=Chryseobacterium indoltheticum TaxID=254 RepID=A0A3G6MZ41_9FLAO|nr:hypothetical protein EG340_07010 [Chryseobacterium indoltheticum]
MTIKVKTPDDQYVIINASHIVYIRPIDGGCNIFLSNDKTITSIESDKTISGYVVEAYSYIYKIKST